MAALVDTKSPNVFLLYVDESIAPVHVGRHLNKLTYLQL